MNVHENKLIRLSMITLLLSLLIVYILLYQIKGDKLHNATYTGDSQDIVVTVKSGDQITFIQPTTIQELTTADNELLQLETNATKGFVASTGQIQGGIHILSGAKLFYGKITSIEKLGIKYQYALLDDKGIFYINLGNQNYDFDTIARALGGSLYKITTEAELAANKLFGNKVIYINLPDYKDKTVLMLIYINTEVRLLQVDYTLYHQSKGYLKSLFIE